MVKTIVFVIIRLHHYRWWRLLFLSVLLLGFTITIFSFPVPSDPVSVTLTYFSRSQTHFCAKNPKLQIHITSSFMIGFWRNLVEIDSYTMPCWRPTFRWPWPTSSGQTRNRPEIFFVTGLDKSRRRRIILATWLDGYCQGPLRIEV